MTVPHCLDKTFAIVGLLLGLSAANAQSPPAPSAKAPIPTLSDAAAAPSVDATCTMQMKQGGLVLCRAPAGAKVYKNAQLVSKVDATGVAAVGLKTDEQLGLRISIDTPDGGMRDFDIDVMPRKDSIRYLSGLDCDKVDARTQAQKDHAARSWETKKAAFARYETPLATGISWAKPADGPFSSPFGPKRQYVGLSKVTGEPCNKTSVHRGLDMATPVGTDLVAPLDGVVTLADLDLYYEGGALFVDHGWGLVSVFMHLSDVNVAPGDVVRTGQVIGATGNTGRTTGPHLHWSVKWRPTADRSDGGFYIDPAILLEMEEVVANGEEREQDQTD